MVDQSEHLFTYPIARDRYDMIGTATSMLKADLKRLGLDAASLRRAVIAAYESEANAVIHGKGGHMSARFSPGLLAVEVADEGPGIADLEMAMREGFSTAPEEARELGFGAGMGLPNIKNNSDRLVIDSTPGVGTRLIFELELVAPGFDSDGQITPHMDPSRCKHCRQCVGACPTAAIRLRKGGPALLKHLCIGCGACIAGCSTGALSGGGVSDPGRQAQLRPLVVPPAFLAQFTPRWDSAQAVETLGHLGFAEVVETGSWETALLDSVAQWASSRSDGNAPRLPSIAPVCPAVVNLIRTRFHALAAGVAPFRSPLAAAYLDTSAGDTLWVALCPAQRNVLLAAGVAAERIVSAAKLAGAVRGLLMEGYPSRRDFRLPALPQGVPAGSDPWLEVSGADEVIDIFERAEDGAFSAELVIVPRMCPGGCFGSPLVEGNSFLSRRVWDGDAVRSREPARAVSRHGDLRLRHGLRLDPDMGRAVRLLREIQQLTSRLPGRDCGDCGAPGCTEFAEDVVLERAGIRDCPYLQQNVEGLRS